MSILTARPEVKFDVKNQEHRAIAHKFFKTNKWSPTDPKFYLDPQFLSVPHMIQAYLTEFYLAKEYGGEE